MSAADILSTFEFFQCFPNEDAARLYTSKSVAGAVRSPVKASRPPRWLANSASRKSPLGFWRNASARRG